MPTTSGTHGRRKKRGIEEEKRRERAIKKLSYRNNSPSKSNHLGMEDTLLLDRSSVVLHHTSEIANNLLRHTIPHKRPGIDI
jgi:hypothetical protein